MAKKKVADESAGTVDVGVIRAWVEKSDPYSTGFASVAAMADTDIENADWEVDSLENWSNWIDGARRALDELEEVIRGS